MLLKGPEPALRGKKAISFLKNSNQTQPDWEMTRRTRDFGLATVFREMGWQTKGYVGVRAYKVGALIYLLVPWSSEGSVPYHRAVTFLVHLQFCLCIFVLDAMIACIVD